jgi:hypothetical protein
MPDPPAGTGSFYPATDENFDRADHMHGWNLAIEQALDNFGRAPGRYSADLVLSAAVEVRNPGYVVEYIAKFR